MTNIELLSIIARQQRGLFSVYQATAVGIGPVTLNRLVRAGAIERVQPGVYAFTSAPPGWRRDLLADVMSIPGLVVSGRSALRLWGVPAPDVLEFSIVRKHRPRLIGDCVVHRASDLEPEDVVFHDGLAVTTLARSLLDAGLTWKSGALKARVRHALEHRLVTPDDLHRLLKRIGRKGRTGAGRLRRVLVAIVPDVNRSELELLARTVLADCSVSFVEQETVRLADGTEVRPDFRAVEVPVFVDVHGFFWHSTPAKLQKDTRRRNQLSQLGTVLEYTWGDLKHHPDRVRDEINRVASALLDKNSPF